MGSVVSAGTKIPDCWESGWKDAVMWDVEMFGWSGDGFVVVRFKTLDAPYLQGLAGLGNMWALMLFRVERAPSKGEKRGAEKWKRQPLTTETGERERPDWLDYTSAYSYPTVSIHPSFTFFTATAAKIEFTIPLKDGNYWKAKQVPATKPYCVEVEDAIHTAGRCCF